MFKINLSPQFSNEGLLIEKSGDILFINGIELDFSGMPNGGEYPPEAIDHPFVIGGVSKDNDVISITVRMPYTNPEPPNGVSFPDPIIVSDDGIIALPKGRFSDVNK